MKHIITVLFLSMAIFTNAQQIDPYNIKGSSIKGGFLIAMDSLIIVDTTFLYDHHTLEIRNDSLCVANTNYCITDLSSLGDNLKSYSNPNPSNE